MGTRAITHIFDRDDLLVSIYRQSDGYLSCHGIDIAQALGSRRLVNGMRGDYRAIANGMGCAAALLIAHLKGDMEAGNIYINRPDPEHIEEFIYTLRGNTMEPDKGIALTVTCYGETLYDGPLSDFDPEAIDAAMIAAEEGGAA